MSTRYRANFLAGVASGVINSLGQTTITGVNFPTTIPPGQYMPIILNPGYYGSANANGGPEIAYVTAVTGTIATVTRGQEGTSSTLASGTTIPWVAGSLSSDFTLSSGIRNGDFPAPTSSGQIFVSTNTISGQFTNTLPSSTVIPSGVTISSGVVIPLANLASGFLPSGVQVSNVWNFTYNPPSGSTSPFGVLNSTGVTVISGFTKYLVFATVNFANLSSGTIASFQIIPYTAGTSITSNAVNVNAPNSTWVTPTIMAVLTAPSTTTLISGYSVLATSPFISIAAGASSYLTFVGIN